MRNEPHAVMNLNLSHRPPRVVVAMSGGVDSSVAAALLVEQGYEVIGMMMRLWSEETAAGGAHNRCCTPDQMNDARRVADRLQIPFYVLDTKDVFRRSIVQFFIDSHRDGVTPNPCIECNRHIRFDFLQRNALAMDADFLATGHYARIDQSGDGLLRLRRGVDEGKDQSYVLSVMGQEQLRHALFPLGEYTKPQVREMAARFGLPTASKQESQDLCFLGDGDYRRFLRENAPDMMVSGPIVRRDGRVIGQHEGLANYTVGQRRGLGIAAADPLYVLALNSDANSLIVGTAEELGSDRLTAKRAHWVAGSPPDVAFDAQVRIRYKARPMPARIHVTDADHFEAVFDVPLRDITPGQGAVVYDGDVVLGCGVIEPRLQ